MNLVCQQEALNNLNNLAEHKRHGVIITGCSGCGKTYLARQYAKFLGIGDFYIINPVISDLKSMIDACVSSGTPVVMCVENLDSGVVQAAYPLLKLIEDCPSYVYIVVTCRNLAAIPETIPSRCAVVEIMQPTAADISQYSKSQDLGVYNNLQGTPIWDCVKGLFDVDMVMQLKPEQLSYFNSLPALLQAKDSVSNISWKLQHYEDNSETPLVLVLRYLLRALTGHKRAACIECLNDLADNRLSKNAIVSKLVFEIKYVQ